MPYYARSPANYYMQQQQRRDQQMRNILNLFMQKQQMGQRQERWEAEQDIREKSLEYDKMRAEAYTKAQEALTKKRSRPPQLTQAQMQRQAIIANPKLNEEQKWGLLSGINGKYLFEDPKEDEALTPYQQMNLLFKKRKANEDILSDVIKNLSSSISNFEQQGALLADKSQLKELRKARAYLIKTYKGKKGNLTGEEIQDILNHTVSNLLSEEEESTSGEEDLIPIVDNIK